MSRSTFHVVNPNANRISCRTIFAIAKGGFCILFVCFVSGVAEVHCKVRQVLESRT